MNDQQKELLRLAYYNPTSGLGTSQALYNIVKKDGYKYKDVKNWHDKQESNQIFKVSKNKSYPAIRGHTNNDYQCDLMFLDEYETFNKGFHVIFTIIELTSRKAYAYPLKNKSERSINEAFKLFLGTVKKVSNLTTDNGSEFISKSFGKIVKDNGINHYFADKNDKNKMGKVERFNRTIREKITKYLNTYKTMKWIHVLDKLMLNYNNSIHSRSGYAPNEVTDEIAVEIRNKERQRSVDAYEVINKFKAGDTIRILKKKDLFDKGKATYSKNIYKIQKIDKLALIVENPDGVVLDKRIKPYHSVKVSGNVEKAPEEDIIEYENEVNRNKRSLKRSRSLRREGIVHSEKLIPENVKRVMSVVNKIDVGSKVKSLFQFEGKMKYFEGVVTKVNLKTYNITFDDGDKHQIKKDEVKLVN